MRDKTVIKNCEHKQVSQHYDYKTMCVYDFATVIAVVVAANKTRMVFPMMSHIVSLTALKYKLGADIRARTHINELQR